MMLVSGAAIAGTEPITLPDIMAFESLKKPRLSDNGTLLAVEAAPDRGPSRTLVRQLTGERSFDIAGGSNPQVSADGRFVVMTQKPPLLQRETADSKAKKQLKNNLILLDTHTGRQQLFERVKSAHFSADGAYLAIWFEAPQSTGAAEKKSAKENDGEKTAKADRGTPMTLLHLAADKHYDFPHVTAFAFSRDKPLVAIASNDTASGFHQLTLLDIGTGKSQLIPREPGQQIGALALSDNGAYLAFTQGHAGDEPDAREYQLIVQQLDSAEQIRVPNTREWQLNRHAKLDFSPDNRRLFFGRVPQLSQTLTLPQYQQEADLFDPDIIAAKRNLRIWHGEDARIKPHEIKQYDKERKRTYLAVMHLPNGNVVQLADKTMPDVMAGPQRRYLLASSDIPYRKMITWAGFYRDYYLVDLNTGAKQLVISQQPSGDKPTLSPGGNYLAYFQQGQVYLHDIAAKRRILLSGGISTPFADEDHDYPSAAPGYGFGPWLADDAGLLVYDKYDIWQFDTRAQQGFMLTDGQGRRNGVQYRVTGLAQDKDRPATLANAAAVMLQGYSERTKGDGFYRATTGQAGVTPLMAGDYKLKLLSRSNDANTLIFSKERYDQFPDLYAAEYLKPEQAKRQTFLDAQKEDFNWSQAELVSWTNGDGRPLDGVLIKPTGYEPGKRYPVLVYYYRFMSDRLHSFPAMKINHRPNFAWYTDRGYAVFLPDIRFEVGYPGPSAVQALTSGVQHIIDMGVADPKAIGLHGHSWSGYQTAFAVTQTHMFAAAVSGAPVSNMTSAFSGIRHGSGLARQFQYEAGQSRIGASLIAAPHKYMENSPVFYADRIRTPMMIMFGDKDDAVPWEQGIELYLAMRRAGRDVVFLQYEDEPHHLKKYPNKLDYSVRMMQYFDHYLKGTPAPDWITRGEAYQPYDKP